MCNVKEVVFIAVWLNCDFFHFNAHRIWIQILSKLDLYVCALNDNMMLCEILREKKTLWTSDTQDGPKICGNIDKHIVHSTELFNLVKGEFVCFFSYGLLFTVQRGVSRYYSSQILLVQQCYDH